MKLNCFLGALVLLFFAAAAGCQSRDFSSTDSSKVANKFATGGSKRALISVSSQGVSPLSKILLEYPSIRQTRYRFSAIFKDLGFATRSLTDPTVQQVIDNISQEVSQLPPEGTFVFLHSGHGFSRKACMRRGVFEPVDIESGLRKANVRIRRLVIFIDSCYSGSWIQPLLNSVVIRGFVDEIIVMSSSSSRSGAGVNFVGSVFSLWFGMTLEILEAGQSISYSDFLSKIQGEARRSIGETLVLPDDAIPYAASFPPEAMNSEFYFLSHDVGRHSNDFRLWIKPFVAWGQCLDKIQKKFNKRKISIVDDAEFLGYKVVRFHGNSAMTPPEVNKLKETGCFLRSQRIEFSPKDFSQTLDPLEYVRLETAKVVECSGGPEFLRSKGLAVMETSEGNKIYEGELRRSELEHLEEMCGT